MKSPLQHWKEVLPGVEIFPFFCFLRDLRGVATRAVWPHGLDGAPSAPRGPPLRGRGRHTHARRLDGESSAGTPSPRRLPR